MASSAAQKQAPSNMSSSSSRTSKKAVGEGQSGRSSSSGGVRTTSGRNSSSNGNSRGSQQQQQGGTAVAKKKPFLVRVVAGGGKEGGSRSRAVASLLVKRFTQRVSRGLKGVKGRGLEELGGVYKGGEQGVQRGERSWAWGGQVWKLGMGKADCLAWHSDLGSCTGAEVLHGGLGFCTKDGGLL